MKAIFGILAFVSLLACLVLPVMHFQGTLDNQTYKQYFLVASVTWFVFAISWAVKGKANRA